MCNIRSGRYRRVHQCPSDLHEPLTIRWFLLLFSRFSVSYSNRFRCIDDPTLGESVLLKCFGDVQLLAECDRSQLSIPMNPHTEDPSRFTNILGIESLHQLRLQLIPFSCVVTV